MSRTSVTIAALVSGVLAVGSSATGCAAAEASPAVRPVNISLVSYGGADPPSGEYNDLAVSCIDDLRSGRDADCESRAEAASASSDSQVAALARLLDTVSEVNQGKTTLSPEQRRRMDRDLGLLPAPVRRPATELVYRAEAIAFAANGDQRAADDAMRTAQQAAPDGRSAEIAAERCRAAPTAPSCTDRTPEPDPGRQTNGNQGAGGGHGDGQGGQSGDATGDDHGETAGNDPGGDQGDGRTGDQQDAQPGDR